MGKRPLSLPAKILIGMVLGMVAGICCHLFQDTAIFRLIADLQLFRIGGNIFMRLFQLIVIPVIFVSLVLGVVSMSDLTTIGRCSVKVILCFTATTVVASLLAIGCALFFKIGCTGSMLTADVTNFHCAAAADSFPDTIIKLVPANFFQALSQANMIQIVIAALFFGIAVSRSAKESAGVIHLLQQFERINRNLIWMVLKLAPLGVFCLLAHTFASFGLAILQPLSRYILCVIGVVAVMMLTVYSLLLLAVRVSPLIFFRKMMPVMLLAFSTSSSNATLPSNIDIVSRKLGIAPGLASFVLSLGATIHMDGTAIMQGCATVLISQLCGVQLTALQIVLIVLTSLLASIGSAGIPNTGVVMLGLVLQSVGLPLSGIALVFGVDCLLDMFETMLNVTGDAVTAVVVGASEKRLDRDVFNAQSAE